ncbi:SDR family oxidoreductase [Cytobacillus purgationiresistens]|uniref:3-oxoacyl-[acyl-carrier protein] reductase n=1 Tax=Cytobacillus purgationiresistens TaxID=863449 RepID=A0ABU0AAI3_9BACI|nr:SDR family oxidoreductase [Cytobacillus purgationiresistens]MDQ0268255.1 3-oxoacyl-[acyl-carrier protein] reductase [Cytobacillus purgationiresistens]
MDLNLKGKVALVQASSQGLGKAIALQLAKEGAKVMISSRSEEKLQAVQQEFKEEYGFDIAFHVADVTKSEDLQALAAKTVEVYGTVDILVNNAGGPPGGTFEDLTDDEWEHAFQLNLLSYVRNIRAVLPELKKNGGKIINVASTSIKQPIPGLLLSNTFRLGIVGLTKTLADELAQYNILINTVAPGRIATDRVDYLDQLSADKRSITKEQVKEESMKKIPLGRYGTPEEFANIVTFLCSDVNSYVTGSSILVDGGMVRSL